MADHPDIAAADSANEEPYAEDDWYGENVGSAR
jgi:hypothetical protein